MRHRTPAWRRHLVAVLPLAWSAARLLQSARTLGLAASRAIHRYARHRGERWPWQVAVWRMGPITAALLCALALSACESPSRPGQPVDMTCAAGDVACLIMAIQSANTSGHAYTIALAAGMYPLTAVENETDGPTGLPSITGVLTILGAGAERTVIERVASAPLFRLVHVAALGTLTLEGITLQGGAVPLFIPGLFGNGGGLLNNGGMLTLIDTALIGNSAVFGGSLFSGGGRVTITDSSLADNSALNSGGGVDSRDGTLMVTNSTLTRNTALFGGGIFSLRGTLTLINSTLTYNTAELTGGGLHNGGMATLTNSTVSSNKADAGGAILNGVAAPRGSSPGTLILINNTVVDNEASSMGGGVFNNIGTVRLHNTILARNTAESASADCRGSGTSLGNNVIGDPSGCAMDLQVSDLTGDPGLGAFTDDGTPGHGFFPLRPESPAVDGGDMAVCPSTDQRGQRRSDGDGDGTIICDIGAIELSP